MRMPAGASSCAATRRRRLNDPARSEPEIPSTTSSPAPRPRPSPLASLHRRYVGRDLHAVAEQRAARLEHLVPVDPEVARPDLTAQLEPDALVAPRVGGDARNRGLELDLVRGVADREVADDAEAVSVERLDLRRAEGDLGVRVGREEVLGAQVLVALLLPGVDAGRADPRLGADVRGLVRLERAVEVGEPPLHRR